MKTRKELISEYKQKKFKAGVFQIRNLATGKVYIESSVDLDAIWNRHRVQLKFGGHPIAELQQDWNTYGEENFVFEILEEIDQKEGMDLPKEVKMLETLYLEDRQPYDAQGYNRRPRKY